MPSRVEIETEHADPTRDEHEREKMIGRDCGSHANAGLCVDQTAEESNRPRRHTRAGPSRSGFAPMRASPRVITTP